MRGLIAICACAAILGGCVVDDDSDSAPETPHQKYMALLRNVGTDTLRIYAEDTIFIAGVRPLPTHAVILVGNGTYNGIRATACKKLTIESEADYLELDCGPTLDVANDTILGGHATRRFCSEKKPADF